MVKQLFSLNFPYVENFPLEFKNFLYTHTVRIYKSHQFPGLPFHISHGRITPPPNLIYTVYTGGVKIGAVMGVSIKKNALCSVYQYFDSCRHLIIRNCKCNNENGRFIRALDPKFNKTLYFSRYFTKYTLYTVILDMDAIYICLSSEIQYICAMDINLLFIVCL